MSLWLWNLVKVIYAGKHISDSYLQNLQDALTAAPKSLILIFFTQNRCPQCYWSFQNFHRLTKYFMQVKNHEPKETLWKKKKTAAQGLRLFHWMNHCWATATIIIITIANMQMILKTERNIIFCITSKLPAVFKMVVTKNWCSVNLHSSYHSELQRSR